MCTYAVTNLNEFKEIRYVMDKSDSLYINSIQNITTNSRELIEVLLFFQAHHIDLYMNKQKVDMDEMIQIVSELNYMISCEQDEYRIRKQEGIKRALEKKRQGIGRYGRPPIKVPVNFEERVAYCKKYHITLETYRKEIGIKRSTFYKKVKELNVE